MVLGSMDELRTLVVIDYIPKVVTTAVMSFAHTHGVVCEIHIAVVAWQEVSSKVEQGLCASGNLQKTAKKVSFYQVRLRRMRLTFRHLGRCVRSKAVLKRARGLFSS